MAALHAAAQPRLPSNKARVEQVRGHPTIKRGLRALPAPPRGHAACTALQLTATATQATPSLAPPPPPGCPPGAHLRIHGQLRLCRRVVEEASVGDAVAHGVPPGPVVQLQDGRPGGGSRGGGRGGFMGMGLLGSTGQSHLVVMGGTVPAASGAMGAGLQAQQQARLVVTSPTVTAQASAPQPAWALAPGSHPAEDSRPASSSCGAARTGGPLPALQQACARQPPRTCRAAP